jgi:hypothetical protein
MIPTAVIASAAHTTARQRREGTRPLGKSRKAKSANPVGKTTRAAQFESQAAQRAPASPPAMTLRSK